MKKFFRFVVFALLASCIACLSVACTSGGDEVTDQKIDVASFFVIAKKTAEEVEYVVKDDGTIEIVSYTDSSVRTEITIPDEIDGHKVTAIKNFSLFNTDTLQRINIGKNVREIGDWALTNNKSMKEFVVDERNEYFTAVDGVLFSKDKKTLICYPTAKNVNIDRYGQTTDTTTYTVPEGTETIANRAFYRCGYLTAVTIPSGVRSIGEMAFHRCEAMTSFVFPEGLESIGKDAFTYCYGLTDITFPTTLKSIDTYAFSFCENVKHIKFLGGKDNVRLGEKWQPTRDGQAIKDLVIE